jgi:hypothetical protein
MAEVKVPFGLDGVAMSKIDWKLALARVSQDLRSDFIYAPHISFIYAKAGVELINEVKSALATFRRKISDFWIVADEVRKARPAALAAGVI